MESGLPRETCTPIVCVNQHVQKLDYIHCAN